MIYILFGRFRQTVETIHTYILQIFSLHRRSLLLSIVSSPVPYSVFFERFISVPPRSFLCILEVLNPLSKHLSSYNRSVCAHFYCWLLNRSPASSQTARSPVSSSALQTRKYLLGLFSRSTSLLILNRNN